MNLCFLSSIQVEKTPIISKQFKQCSSSPMNGQNLKLDAAAHIVVHGASKEQKIYISLLLSDFEKLPGIFLGPENSQFGLPRIYAVKCLQYRDNIWLINPLFSFSFISCTYLNPKKSNTVYLSLTSQIKVKPKMHLSFLFSFQNLYISHFSPECGPPGSEFDPFQP